jgi:hypothetical protein
MVYSGWEIYDKLNSVPATQFLDAAQQASHKRELNGDIQRQGDLRQASCQQFLRAC